MVHASNRKQVDRIHLNTNNMIEYDAAYIQ